MEVYVVVCDYVISVVGIIDGNFEDEDRNGD